MLNSRSGGATSMPCAACGAIGGAASRSIRFPTKSRSTSIRLQSSAAKALLARSRMNAPNQHYLEQRMTHLRITRERYIDYQARASRPRWGEKFIYLPLMFQPERTSCPQGGIFSNQQIMVNLLSSLAPRGDLDLCQGTPDPAPPQHAIDASALGRVLRNAGEFSERAPYRHRHRSVLADRSLPCGRHHRGHGGGGGYHARQAGAGVRPCLLQRLRRNPSGGVGRRSEARTRRNQRQSRGRSRRCGSVFSRDRDVIVYRQCRCEPVPPTRPRTTPGTLPARSSGVYPRSFLL